MTRRTINPTLRRILLVLAAAMTLLLGYYAGNQFSREQLDAGSATLLPHARELPEFSLVGQDGEPPVNIVGMRLDDAIKLIKGPKGTVVDLTVRRVDGTIEEIYADNLKNFGVRDTPEQLIRMAQFSFQEIRAQMKSVARQMDRMVGRPVAVPMPEAAE